MRLTVQTDYALRMLMYLAIHADSLVTIHDVAERYGISKNHLMKVAHGLGRAGFIETLRGRSGGLRLAKPAEDIPLGAVARHFEQGSALVECFPAATGGASSRRAANSRAFWPKRRKPFSPFSISIPYTIS